MLSETAPDADYDLMAYSRESSWQARRVRRGLNTAVPTLQAPVRADAERHVVQELAAATLMTSCRLVDRDQRHLDSIAGVYFG